MFNLELILYMLLRVQLHSFAFGYSVFPIPFVEKSVLSPLANIGTLVKKSQLDYRM